LFLANLNVNGSKQRIRFYTEVKSQQYS